MVKFWMLVVSQRHVSQFQKDVSFTTEENVCIYYNFQTFLNRDMCGLDATSIKNDLKSGKYFKF